MANKVLLVNIALLLLFQGYLALLYCNIFNMWIALRSHNRFPLFDCEVQSIPEEVETEYEVTEAVEVDVLCASDKQYAYAEPEWVHKYTRHYHIDYIPEINKTPWLGYFRFKHWNTVNWKILIVKYAKR